MPRVVLVLVTAVLLAACGGQRPPVIGGPDTPGSGEDIHTCGAASFTADELADAPPATELGASGRAALDGHSVPAIDPADGWRVLTETDRELVLVRDLDEPQASDHPGDVRTHEVVGIRTISGASNVPDGDWVLDSAGSCTPRLDLGALGQADLALRERPAPDATEVALAVHERACASGQAADGRVEVVSQELTDDQLRLVVGVRPADGAQACPSNPPTPVTVQLDQPLGDREVVDAALLPPRPLDVAPGTQPSPTGGEPSVDRALAYQPPASYVMDVEVACFCPAPDRFRVTVEDGRKVDVQAVDPDGDRVTGEPVDHPDLAPTITDIQDRLREAHADGEVVELHLAEDGRPVVVGLDPMPNAIDDEVTYVVTAWQSAP